MKDTVHQLRITLHSVKPPVWRLIAIRSDTNLAELAAILEASTGWLGGHLHAFEGPKARYAMPDPEWPDDDLDEREYRVRDVLPDVGSKLRWDYDFGDGWEHVIVVEEIGADLSDIDLPICLAGSMACPPEDCGGPMGYEDMLGALTDPAHPEHDLVREWAPPDFDPTYFDVNEATSSMRSVRPLAVGRGQDDRAPASVLSASFSCRQDHPHIVPLGLTHLEPCLQGLETQPDSHGASPR